MVMPSTRAAASTSRRRRWARAGPDSRQWPMSPLVTDTNWSAVVSLPMLVVAYVVGLLAIASVEACGPSTTPDVEGLRDPAVAPRYAKLDQEAEILSGSVVGFALLGVAAIANIRSFSGWTRTLLFTAALCLTLSFLAWKMSRAKRALAAHLLQRASRPAAVIDR